MLSTSKLANRPLREAFRNDDGAIDLASIMVGIIVIGIIGGVIAATIFAVIPWSQDNGAKQQLDNVATAQSAYRGLAADTGKTGFGAYDGSTELKSTTGATLLAKNISDLKVIAGTNSAGDPCYVASITSASGTKFYATDKTKASKTAPADNCSASTPAAANFAISGTTDGDYDDSGSKPDVWNMNEKYLLKDADGNTVTGATWSVENVTVSSKRWDTGAYDVSGTAFPSNLKLDPATGTFTGYLPYSPGYAGIYEGKVAFTLKATRGSSVTTTDISYKWSFQE